MEIKKIGVESIPIIQSLAHHTWEIAYKNILSADQMSYMLKLFYSRESLQHQIEDKGHQFILVTNEEETAGFASYGIKNKSNAAVYNLHKIYISPNIQGKGIGMFLLNYIIDDVKQMHGNALELNVNRNNKALSFYQKFGFEIIDEQDIPIGEGYFMNDYIMRLSW